MSYATAYIASTLKAAREGKGLSQRALSQLAGVPQAHISKIERGAVDLRLSSLVELARVLDLELALVPRKSVPAVNSIVRSTEGTPHLSGASTKQSAKELKRLQRQLADMTRLSPLSTELAQLQRQTRDLQHLGIVSDQHLETLREANKSLRLLRETGDAGGIHQTLDQIQRLRNAIAHSASNPRGVEKVRPAYALEDADGE